MRRKIGQAILIFCLLQTAQLPASSYCDVDLTAKIDDHRWGVWRMVDVPTKNAENMFEWDNFKTYWFLGFGPFFVVQVSQGTLVAFILFLTVIVGLYAYKLKRAKKSEQIDGEGRS